MNEFGRKPARAVPNWKTPASTGENGRPSKSRAVEGRALHLRLLDGRLIFSVLAAGGRLPIWNGMGGFEI